MKIPVWVKFEQEIEIDITAEQIAAAIGGGDRENINHVLIGISNFSRFIRIVPEAVVAEMTKEQREVVCNFLKEQVGRFDDSIHPRG